MPCESWGGSNAPLCQNSIKYDIYGRVRLTRSPGLDTSGRRIETKTIRFGMKSEKIFKNDLERSETFFDNLGRPISIIESGGSSGDRTTTVEYDGYSVEMSRGSQTRVVTTDNRGFLTAESHPEWEGAASYLYDALGNLIEETYPGPNGQTLQYIWDPIGRLQEVRRIDGSHDDLLKFFTYHDQVVGGDGSPRL